MELELTYVGCDSWDRPVYQCGEMLYVDVDPNEGHPPDICTKNGNEFDGEPLSSIGEGTIVKFIPRRVTW